MFMHNVRCVAVCNKSWFVVLPPSQTQVLHDELQEQYTAAQNKLEQVQYIDSYDIYILQCNGKRF